jgi:hypothetical protein
LISAFKEEGYTTFVFYGLKLTQKDLELLKQTTTLETEFLKCVTILKRPYTDPDDKNSREIQNMFIMHLKVPIDSKNEYLDKFGEILSKSWKHFIQNPEDASFLEFCIEKCKHIVNDEKIKDFF